MDGTSQPKARDPTEPPCVDDLIDQVDQVRQRIETESDEITDSMHRSLVALQGLMGELGHRNTALHILGQQLENSMQVALQQARNNQQLLEGLREADRKLETVENELRSMRDTLRQAEFVKEQNIRLKERLASQDELIASQRQTINSQHQVIIGREAD